jgi:3D (Asp-Asp-Asp) domain-containing protein
MKSKITFGRYVLALFCACALVFMGYAVGMTYKWVQTRLAETTALKSNLGALSLQIVNNKAEIEQYKTQINSLSAEISSLRQEVEHKQDKADRGGERGTRRMMSVTAYDLSVESCGKLPSHPEYSITASGERVKEWYTVAAGPELPFGTQIFIPYFADKPNKGIFTVQDRGSAVKDGCIDVYIADNAECWEFGRQKLEVWVMEGEG